jgi:putative peptidoglycan lipid II flippase
MARPAWANAATVGFLTSLVKLAGAVKIVATARYFGAGDELDAFLTAFIAPSVLADVVAGTFTPVLVPALIRTGAEHGFDAARRLARSAAGLALGAMLVVACALAVAGRWILPLLGTSFAKDKLALTQTLFLGLLCWLPLGALISCWRAVLNSHNSFALAAGVPLATPLVTLIFLYGGATRWGVYALCAATLTGVLIECLILAAAIRRLGYPVWPGALLLPPGKRWTPELNALGRAYLPLMAGALISSASLLIDQAFTGALGPGAVSALAYGTKLAAVLLSVTAAGIATAVLPEFSAMAAADQWERLRRSVLTHSVMAILLIIPVALVLILLSGPIVHVFFEGGRFDAAAARLVSVVQQCALIEAPFAILFAIASRLANSLSANELLVRAGVAALAVNLMGDWLLSRWMGVAGIALSTSIARAVSLAVLAALLYRREPRVFVRG